MKEFPKLSGRLVLAPMHNVTNIAFRLMCKKYGAVLVSTELLSANAIARKNKAAMKNAKTCELERPVCAQIFSNNTENMVKAAKVLEKECDIIDINLGCPSDKIIKQGSGGALLKRKNKLFEIVSGVVKNIDIPVTVKIRSGFDKQSINAVEIAQICEQAGASAITIHARTVEQGYSGKADLNLIKKVKQAVKITVIGNGDVFAGQDAERMFKETGCDYIMIGRGAIGNPHVFEEINHFLETGEEIRQAKEERIKDYFEYIELAKKLDIFELKDAKIKAQEFTKGFPGSARLRQGLNRVKTMEEIKELFKEFERKR